MVLLLNTRAAGGTALKKWRKIESEFTQRFRPSQIHTPRNFDAMSDHLQQALRDGETDFVAAGGDGTVNALLQELLLNIEIKFCQMLSMLQY